MAEFVKQLRAVDGKELLVFYHVVAASPQSYSVKHLLTRLCLALKQRCSLQLEPPSTMEALRESWMHFALMAAQRHLPVVLVFDGVNQLSAEHHALSLDWLPHSLPDPRIKVFVSMIEDDAQHQIIQRRIRGLPASVRKEELEVAVEPMTREDSERLLEAFLFSRYRKSLTPRQMQAMLDKPDAGSPLYIVTAAGWLAQLGVYEEMDREIGSLPGRKITLLRAVLDAMILRFGEGVVRSILLVVYFSEGGVFEHELMQLVAEDLEREALSFALVYQQVKALVPTNSSGLLSFFHNDMRTLIFEVFLSGGGEHVAAGQQKQLEVSSDEERRESLRVNRMLAQFYLKQVKAANHELRTVQVLTVYMERAEMFGELEEVLLVPAVFHALFCSELRGTLFRLWGLCLGRGGRGAPVSAATLAERYRESLSSEAGAVEDPLEEAKVLCNLGEFFLASRGDAGGLELSAAEAESFFTQALVCNPREVSALVGLSRLERSRGKLEEATEHLRSAMLHLQQSRGYKHIETARCQSEMAEVLLQKGDAVSCRQVMAKARKIASETCGKHSLEYASFLLVEGDLLRRIADGKDSPAELLAVCAAKYREAMETQQLVVGGGHPALLASLDRITELCLRDASVAVGVFGADGVLHDVARVRLEIDFAAAAAGQLPAGRWPEYFEVFLRVLGQEDGSSSGAVEAAEQRAGAALLACCRQSRCADPLFEVDAASGLGLFVSAESEVVELLDLRPPVSSGSQRPGDGRQVARGLWVVVAGPQDAFEVQWAAGEDVVFQLVARPASQDSGGSVLLMSSRTDGVWGGEEMVDYLAAEQQGAWEVSLTERGFTVSWEGIQEGRLAHFVHCYNHRATPPPLDKIDVLTVEGSVVRVVPCGWQCFDIPESLSASEESDVKEALLLSSLAQTPGDSHVRLPTSWVVEGVPDFVIEWVETGSRKPLFVLKATRGAGGGGGGQVVMQSFGANDTSPQEESVPFVRKPLGDASASRSSCLQVTVTMDSDGFSVASSSLPGGKFVHQHRVPVSDMEGVACIAQGSENRPSVQVARRELFELAGLSSEQLMEFLELRDVPPPESAEQHDPRRPDRAAQALFDCDAKHMGRCLVAASAMRAVARWRRQRISEVARGAFAADGLSLEGLAAKEAALRKACGASSPPHAAFVLAQADALLSLHELTSAHSLLPLCASTLERLRSSMDAETMRRMQPFVSVREEGLCEMLSRNGTLDEHRAVTAALEEHRGHPLHGWACTRLPVSATQTALDSLPRVLRWGARVGPKIGISGNRCLVRDEAVHPRDGDDGKGRYRPAIADTGFDAGVHEIRIRFVKRGRCQIGVATAAVDAEWREGCGKAGHQTDQAWIVCPSSSFKASDFNYWHDSKQFATGLPVLREGGVFSMILDCDHGTLRFQVDGVGPSGSARHLFTGLPVGQRLFPFVAFGGDEVRGCALEILPVRAPQVVDQRGVPTGRVYITHATYEGEYLYATQHNDGAGRRYIHTWMNGGEPANDEQAQWVVEEGPDESYVVVHGHWDNYLYARYGDDGEGRRGVHLWMKGGTAQGDWQAHWDISPVADRDGVFVIKAVGFNNEYLYATQHSDGEGRRFVHTWMQGGDPVRDPQALWVIRAAG